VATPAEHVAPRALDRRPLATAAGLALVAGLAALDVSWGPDRIVTATVVIAPFLTALAGSSRQTALVAAAAVAVAVLSGSWNDNFGAVDYLVRLLVVVAGASFAVAGAHLQQRLRRDRARFRVLSAAAELGDASATVEAVVERLRGLLVPELADICVIDVDRDGETERLAVAVAGPRGAEVEAELWRRGGAPDRPGSDAATAMRRGRPYLIKHATDDMVRDAAADESELAFLRSLQGRSTIVVPLRTRGRNIGSMTLIATSASGRRYDEDDLEFAQILSGRVALALDNAGLFSELESLEAQRGAALGSLAEAVTMQDARGRLVYANEAAARSLGFASARVLLATPAREIVDAFESFNEDGSPLRLDQLPGRRVLAGETPEPLLVRAIHRTTGAERWRVVKATAVPDQRGRPRLAVNVIEDVTEAKRAELVQRFLARAGELLSSSLDYEETLTQVARLAVPRLADWCGVSIPDEHGFVRSVAVAHVDPAKVRFAHDYNQRYPARVSDQGGAAQVMRDGRSQVVNEIPEPLLERAIPDRVQLQALRTIGMRAVMIVPMVGARGVVGAISFVSAESGRTFSDADIELAEELGRRAGVAVENARLYTERSQIAHTLQASLLPGALPDVPGFRLAVMYRPAGEESFVGGDFYDAFATDSGWMFMIGDVTGRGAEAAGLTAQARHTLRTAGALLDDPVAAIERLNHALVAESELSICTVALVKVAERGEVTEATVVCAGHPQPYLVRDGRARAVGRSAPVVGAWEDSAWEPQTIELVAGDVLVLYTDGVLDARGEDDRFGGTRLEAALAGVTSADDAVARVRTALERFEQGAHADDTAVVAVQRVASPVGGLAGGAPGQRGARG
jgi:PAS domain S-box-containing protein